MTVYWSANVNIALSGTVFAFLTLNDIMTLKSGLSRSFKPVLFESLAAVSYALSIITIIIIIKNVKIRVTLS